MQWGSSSKEPQPIEPSKTGLSVIFEPTEAPTVDIVFFHGFTGDPLKTWSSRDKIAIDENGHTEISGERPAKFRKLLPHNKPITTKTTVPKHVYWPRDLLPHDFPNARVMTYGYDTNIYHTFRKISVSKDTVYDIAWNALVALDSKRRPYPKRPLLFVAHSLGGIVSKEIMRQSRGAKLSQSHLFKIYESTIGFVFFGTPHSGSDPRGMLLHIVEILVKAGGYCVNENVVNALLPSSERLKELRREFGPMAREKNWMIHSFQEQHGIALLSGKKHINSDHMDMCRFDSRDDAEYGKVVAALQRFTLKKIKTTPLDLVDALDTEKYQIFMDDLKFTQMESRHATIKRAHARTCKLVLSNAQYKKWRDPTKLVDHQGFFWIKGKPGTGKSTVMKYLFGNARRSFRNSIVVSFFFNARGHELEQSIEGMYRSLLFQVLDKIPRLQEVFSSIGVTGHEPPHEFECNITTLKELFENAVQMLADTSLVCFVDALDECDEDQVRDMISFFEVIGEKLASSTVEFRVCFSSRHYPHISIDKCVEMIMEGEEGHRQDMASYIDSELKIGHGKIAEEIKMDVLNRASGFFLWVVLVVPILRKEHDRGRIHALRKRLHEIPSGLEDLFEDILKRDAENREELLSLKWLCYARSQLTRQELYFAILAGSEDYKTELWDHNEATLEVMERFILNASKALVEVNNKGIVQFIHETVRHFFLFGQGFQQIVDEIDENSLGMTHDHLKQICLRYFSGVTDQQIEEIRGHSDPFSTIETRKDAQSRFQKHLPFLKYATLEVLGHSNRAQDLGVSQDVFIREFPRAQWNCFKNGFNNYGIRDYDKSCSIEYILAAEGLPHLVQNLDDRRHLEKSTRSRYGYPLNAAIVGKHWDVVGVLLQPDKNMFKDIDSPQTHPFYYTKDEWQEVLTGITNGTHTDTAKKGQKLLQEANPKPNITFKKVLYASSNSFNDPERLEDEIKEALRTWDVAWAKLLFNYQDFKSNSPFRDIILEFLAKEKYSHLKDSSFNFNLLMLAVASEDKTCLNSILKDDFFESTLGFSSQQILAMNLRKSIILAITKNIEISVLDLLFRFYYPQCIGISLTTILDSALQYGSEAVLEKVLAHYDDSDFCRDIKKSVTWKYLFRRDKLTIAHIFLTHACKNINRNLFGIQRGFSVAKRYKNRLTSLLVLEMAGTCRVPLPNEDTTTDSAEQSDMDMVSE